MSTLDVSSCTHLKETCWVNAGNCCVGHLKYSRNFNSNGLEWWIGIQGMLPIGEFLRARAMQPPSTLFCTSLRVPCGVGTSARDKASQSWSNSEVLSMWNYSALIWSEPFSHFLHQEYHGISIFCPIWLSWTNELMQATATTGLCLVLGRAQRKLRPDKVR